jgi:hypothetical protein
LDVPTNAQVEGGLTGSGAAALASALAEGWAPRLQSLHLEWLEEEAVEQFGADEVGRALQAHPRPLLRSLTLDVDDDCEALGEALAAGACPGLTSLCCQYACEQIVEAVVGGCCPDLRHLSGRLCFGGVNTLINGIRSHALLRLESLLMVESDMDYETGRALFEALGARPCPCPSLRELDVSRLGFGLFESVECCQAIGHALGGGGLSSLEALYLRENCCIDADGVVVLAEALRAGAGANLTTLDLFWAKSGHKGAWLWPKPSRPGGSPA